MENWEASMREKAPEKWVLSIQKLLEEKEAENIRVCILKVRQVLKDTKPEDYTPRLIGLGPYHHMSPNLYEMQLYKLIAAKKVAAENQEEAIQTLKNLVEGLNSEHIAQIRACYDRYLDIDDNQLSWMMVIDAIFLIEFLQVVVKHEQDSYLYCHKRMSYLVDPTQTAYHSILQDIMMLENQIPVIVLDHIVSEVNNILHRGSLLQLLSDTCTQLSPFRRHQKNRGFDYDDIEMPSHLLELLYYKIVPKDLAPSKPDDCPPPQYVEAQTSQSTDVMVAGGDLNVTNCFVQMLGKLNLHAMHIRPFNFIVQLLTSTLPAFQSSCRENSSSGSHDDTESLCVGQIKIPSASELLEVGVKFCRSDDSFPSCISFDRVSKKFHLPAITMDENTEVIMRNLVAFEAAAIQGPLVLARYTELMNGIINEEEDVKILRESRVIERRLKSDEIVTEMWNCMSKCIRLSCVPGIDEAIKEVNQYYANKKRVRFERFTKECMFRGWKILMLFFMLLLLVLMIIQSFCDVYKCSRVVEEIYGSAGQNGASQSR